METAKAAFVIATPVRLSPNPHKSVATALEPNCQAALFTRSATPSCNHTGVRSTKASNVLSFLASRSKHDTEKVLNFLNDYAPVNTTTAAALSAACLLALSPPSLPSALAEVPQTLPSEVVVDDASVIPTGNEQLFTKAAKAIKDKTGVSIHFVIVPSLPFGDTPEDFALELASQWKLGQDDVLFAASTKLARAGVFVGNSAQKLLSDDVARSIAEETFGLPAGEEQYGAALLGVSNRLIPVLNGEADPGPPSTTIREVVQTYKTKEETKKDRDKYVKIVGGVLVISVVAPLIQTYWYVRDD